SSASPDAASAASASMTRTTWNFRYFIARSLRALPWARRKPIGNLRGPPVSREWPIGTSTFGSALGSSPPRGGRSDGGELLRVLLAMADDEPVRQRVDPPLPPRGVGAQAFGGARRQRSAP